MTTLEELIAKILHYAPNADQDMIRLAFEYAAEAHAGETRLNGEPYISHPLRVAEILADMRMPAPIIIAGLLHDIPEDTTFTIDDVRKNFGDDVASMVVGISKLGKIKYRGLDRYIENLRKMFVAIAADIRVILIKFADRIHNLETLDGVPAHKRARIALESLEIYAPIANRLGMNEIKIRLEELAFKHLDPKEYEWASRVTESAVRGKTRYIESVKKTLADHFAAANIGAVEIQGRVKHLYSLYKKLLTHDRDIARVHDLVALRIIVKNVGDCYAALGIIHQHWKPLAGRIKDYIAQPKPNGYRSLHTTVFCIDGDIVEFQIRTEEMHEEAERGIVAHWHYDESGKTAKHLVDERLAWVKDLALEHAKAERGDDGMESLEHMKIDVFQNRIFVFTPKGDVIDLPEDATPVDFAYAIHTTIGNTCTGARINDNIVSLDSRLHSGDVCDIIVDKNRKGPNPDWLTFVKTGTARAHIRSRTKSTAQTWITERELQ